MRLVWQPKHDRVRQERQSEGKPTTLIVDEDLGFTFWLGQALDATGWRALPAQNVTAAYDLVRVHRLHVEVLVIDPFGRNAFALVAYLRKIQPFLTVVAAIPEDWDRSWPPLPEFDAAIRKPLHFTSAAKMEWVDLIQNLLSNALGEFEGGPDTVEN